MQILVNSEEYKCDKNMTLLELLCKNSIEISHVVVSLDDKIIDPDAYSETELTNGNRVDIVTFVGGG